MNNNTRKDLQEFISAIQILTNSISFVCGTGVLENIHCTAENLKAQLDKDETILP